MLLQVTKALTAMAAEVMVVVRATVEITVAAAVEAKEVTTLAVARAVLSDVGEAGMASSKVALRMRQCRSCAAAHESVSKLTGDALGVGSPSTEQSQ